MRTLLQRRASLWVPLLFLLTLSVLGLAAPVLSPWDPIAVDLAQKLAPPSAAHWLGTDLLGRDILTRLLYGIRTTFFVSLVTMLCTCVIGALYGTVAVLSGPRVERLLMRLCDALMSFPSEVLILAAVGMLGAGLENVVIASVLAKWSWYARMMRSLLIGIHSKGYLRFAQLAGASRLRLLRAHYLPAVAGEFSVLMTLDSAGVMLMLSSLGFLGLGIQPPTPEWGMMLSEAKEVFFTAPYQMVPAGLAIALTALAMNFLGDGLRDALDVRPQHAQEQR